MNIALWEAAQANDAERVRDLMDWERHRDLTAQPNAKGLSGWTTLHVAASHGAVDAIKVLLEPAHGVDVSARTSLGRMPLHLAFLNGHLDVADLLLEHGADLNAADYDGNTCLHLAVSKDSAEAVAWLCARRADPNVFDKLGKRPVDVAESIEMQHIVEGYMKSLNVSSRRRSYGRTPFQGVLRHNSRVDTVSALLAKARMQTPAKVLKKFYKQYGTDRSKTRCNSPTRINTFPQSDDESIEEAFTCHDFLPLCVLGKGSFGEVFLVRKANTNKDYALKVISKSEVFSHKLERYILTERRVMSYVKHPFIMPLKAAFQTSENLLILMDYMPGGELSSYLNREKKFSEDKAKLYISEIILALEALHQHKVAYRDLKPSNILLDADGHVVLTDFGLAKERMEEGVMTHSFCGSPAYLPPEILAKAGHTTKVDWYQLGVLLYEMLTGAPPFFSHTRQTMFNNIKSAALTFPRHVSPAAKDLIMKLMERRPDDRLTNPDNIKAHPFFEEISWKEVAERKLKMPPPRFHRPKTQSLNRDKIYGGSKPMKSLEEWSFLAESR